MNILNFQSLIATKDSRLLLVAPASIVVHFGSRRVQEMKSKGQKLSGIRLNSWDLFFPSKEFRRILDYARLK